MTDAPQLTERHLRTFEGRTVADGPAEGGVEAEKVSLHVVHVGQVGEEGAHLLPARGAQRAVDGGVDGITYHPRSRARSVPF